MSAVFDAASNTVMTGGAGNSWTHTPVGTPTAVGVWVYASSQFTLPSIFTYGGVSMTLLFSGGGGAGNDPIVLYGLTNPPPGPQTVVVGNPTDNIRGTSVAVSVTGSSLTTCFRDIQTTNGQGLSSITAPALASQNGDLCVDALFVHYNTSVGVPTVDTPGPPNTRIYSQIYNSDRVVATDGSQAPATGPTTMTWAITNGGSVAAAAAVVAAAFENAPPSLAQPAWAETSW